MKKKLITLILTMTMVLTIMACGKSESLGGGDNNSEVGTEIGSETEGSETEGSENVDSESGAAEDGVKTAADNKVETTVQNEIEEISFSILDDGKEVLEKLGDPASVTDGDNNYHTNSYYNSAEVTYSADGDNVEIIEFKSFSDQWKTSKGITIASTLDEVKAAYGEPSYESTGADHDVSYFYSDGYSISFSFNDNNEVTYFLIELGRG